MPTPFRAADGRFEPGPFRDNLHRWMQHRLAGVLVLGSNGEAPLLTEAESDAVVAAARQAVPRDRLLLVGTGRPSTAATIAATRRAFEAGADAALVLTPAYYRSRMDATALARYYETVARQAGGPLLIYHVPAHTGLDVAVDMVLELAADPGIAGIKDSSGDVSRIERLAAGRPADFAVLTGHAGTLYAALASGAQGAIVAAACVVPDACCDLLEAVTTGEHARARALQARLTPLAQAVTVRHGVAGLKALMDHLGWAGGPVRSPLLELGAPGHADILETWRHFVDTQEAGR